MAERLPPTPAAGGALRVPRRRLVPELLSGVTLAALALPLNLGYAEAAGLPPTAGLYATVVPLAVYAALAGSRHLVIGPDATIAAIAAGVLAPLATSSGAAPEELAAALAGLTGVALVAAWALRAGGVVRYLSRAVLVGFIAGLAIEVLTSQVRKILAVDVHADTWLGEVAGLVRHLPRLSPASVLTGVATIALLRLLAARAPRLPAALVALTLVTVAVAVVRPRGVAVLGEVPSGLPRLSVPVIGLGTWLELLPGALAIAALTVAEGLLLAGNAARRRGETFGPNAELFALGAANVAAAVTGSMPSGASSSRTAAMAATGSRSQLPSVVAAAVVTVVVVVAPGLVGSLPTAALAGLVANAVVATIDVRALRWFAGVRRSELALALVCAAGVLLLGPLPGIVVAVLASVVDVVRRSAGAAWHEVELSGEPATGRYRRSSSGATAGDVLVLRPGGDLFFANADQARDRLLEVASTKGAGTVVLDLERVSDVDPTAAEALLEAVRAVRESGRVLALARVDADLVPLLDRYALLDAIGREHVFASNRQAEDQLAASALDAQPSPPSLPEE